MVLWKGKRASHSVSVPSSLVLQAKKKKKKRGGGGGRRVPCIPASITCCGTLLCTPRKTESSIFDLL